MLPVVWIHPLPCWLSDLVHTMELGGEAVIPGKRLMREATQSLPLGYRNIRVDALWTQASSSSFTLTYELRVEQFVAQQRDGRPIRGETTYWLFDVEGVAKYSFRDQAWDSIDEKIRARPKKISDEKMKFLRDEVFTGTIEIRRAAASRGKKPRSRRRRKTT